MLLIEDEIEFLVNNYEHLVDPQTSIHHYLANKKGLVALLVMNCLFEGCVAYYVYTYEDVMLIQLDQIYQIGHLAQFQQFFEIVSVINHGFNFLAYLYGFYAISSNKVTSYQIFTLMLMVSLFFSVFMTYLNALNVLLFTLKIITYIFARYVMSLLFTVLLVPASQSLQYQHRTGSINDQLQRYL